MSEISFRMQRRVVAPYALLGMAAGFVLSLVPPTSKLQEAGALYVLGVLAVWKLLASLFGSAFADNSRELIVLVTALVHGVLLAGLLTCTTWILKGRASSRAVWIAIAFVIAAFILFLFFVKAGIELP